MSVAEARGQIGVNDKLKARLTEGSTDNDSGSRKHDEHRESQNKTRESMAASTIKHNLPKTKP